MRPSRYNRPGTGIFSNHRQGKDGTKEIIAESDRKEGAARNDHDHDVPTRQDTQREAVFKKAARDSDDGNRSGGIGPCRICSGATVYSLRTGISEDVSQWLVEKYRNEIQKDSALGKLLLELYRLEQLKIFPTKDTGDEDECPGAVGFSGEDLWPTPAGITFRPVVPYSQSACIVDVNVPYGKMAPYLSPLGKSNAKVFRGR